MSTERLYYQDSFLREFDAQVLSCEPAGDQSSFTQRGAAWRVLLDRTAFYPTSGGQPHDTGTLADASVVEILDGDDETVVHLTDRPVAAGRVCGAIDWARRFDHMQQHTGQHLLSAAFFDLFKLSTVSFHMGRDASTIDLAAPEILPEQLVQAERRANEIIFDDRPVTVSFGTAQALAAAGVRKAVEHEGILRLIEIEGFDRQPCGGTHMRRTGQVGLVLVRKCEKVKQNWRVEFVCGGRAAGTARDDLEMLNHAARQLSCGFADVPVLLTRAIEERRAGYRAQQRLLERLAEVEAEMLLALRPAQDPGAGGASEPRVVLHVLEDASADYLRLLAGQLINRAPVCVLLGARSGGHVLFAQAADLPGDMNGLLREIVAACGGKGGGTKHFAQGTVPNAAALDEVLSRARALLRR